MAPGEGKLGKEGRVLGVVLLQCTGSTLKLELCSGATVVVHISILTVGAPAVQLGALSAASAGSCAGRAGGVTERAC